MASLEMTERLYFIQFISRATTAKSNGRSIEFHLYKSATQQSSTGVTEAGNKKM